MLARITPNKGTFHAVRTINMTIIIFYQYFEKTNFEHFTYTCEHAYKWMNNHNKHKTGNKKSEIAFHRCSQEKVFWTN